MDSTKLKAAGVVGAVAESLSVYISYGGRQSIAGAIAIQGVILAAMVWLLWVIRKTDAARPLIGQAPARSVIAASVLLLISWCAELNREFWFGWMPLSTGAWAATFYLLSLLLTCAFPVYPIWTYLLHRRRGALMLGCSIVCAGWSAIELAFQVHY